MVSAYSSETVRRTHDAEALQRCGAFSRVQNQEIMKNIVELLPGSGAKVAAVVLADDESMDAMMKHKKSNSHGSSYDQQDKQH